MRNAIQLSNLLISHSTFSRHLCLADQYLCLDQVKDDKAPPPPQAGAEAQPVPPPVAVAPPPPPPIVKVPAPPPIQQDKDNSKIEPPPEEKKEEEADPESGMAVEPVKSGGHPFLTRILICVTNVAFTIVLFFWIAVLFTGLHIADIEFVNNWFMG